MEKPKIAAPIAHSNTAPAAMSLAAFTEWCSSGETTSQINSNAVLMVSAKQTKVMATISQRQSFTLTFSQNAVVMTVIEIIKCSHALCCVFSTNFRPFMAKTKLFKRLVNVNL